MNKPIILTFVAYYLPGHKSGGPVRTIANMVEQLGDKLDFYIVTSDRDNQDLHPYPDIIVDDWNSVGKGKVFYASSRVRSIVNLVHLIKNTPHDVIYLNSFFNPIFTLLPLLVRRFRMLPKKITIIAPRGEFSKGALALKWLKKRIYIKAIKIIGLYHNLIWHASSEHELKDICKILGSVSKRIVIAPDMPSRIENIVVNEKQVLRKTNRLKVCFLSRISPMKNLDYAIQVMSKLKIPIEFNIYGVVDDESYWRLCQKLIKELPSNIAIHYHGSIEHKNVPDVLSQQDLFFLPTRGENYGHVIFEALASGLPVLISDQTPWRNLEELGVGWDIPLQEADKFCIIIEEQAKLNETARVKQMRIVRQYAASIAEDKKVIAKNLALFTDLVPKSHRRKRNTE